MVSALEVRCVCKGVGLHDCGGPHPPLLQHIHREPGAGHAGEWVGWPLWGMCACSGSSSVAH